MKGGEVNISKVHADVWFNIRALGPLTANGHRRLQNRGVRREWRERKRIDAELRSEETPHERTRAHRLSRCECGH